MTPPRTWTLTLPQTSPLSLNGRLHWRVRARLTREFRRAAWALATAAKIPPLDRVAVELHYAPRDQRRRDPINLALTLKAVEDGIVDAGVIPDDTPDHCQSPMPTIDPPSGTGRGRLYAVVREVLL